MSVIKHQLALVLDWTPPDGIRLVGVSWADGSLTAWLQIPGQPSRGISLVDSECEWWSTLDYFARWLLDGGPDCGNDDREDWYAAFVRRGGHDRG